jgi:hypothetical protein
MSDEAADNVHVPLEFIQHLARLAAESGTESSIAKALESLPGVARFAPTVDVGQPMQMLALELGRLISSARSPKGQYVFLKDDAIVTLDENTGKLSGLSAGRFMGWAEQFCAFRSSGRQSKREGLTRDDAAAVLEQDVFRDCLRPLRAVHTMRLPVTRANGDVEFLEPGYDTASAIFTCDLVKYPMNWTVDASREWLVDVCSEVPWNGKEEGELRMNRSLSVHVANLLGNYCHALFPEGTLRPMIAYFANKPGTGKTRMAEMSLAHVHGFVGGTTAPKDEDKMDVKLETIARAMRPFVIFDDIGGALRSNSLNKFLTETRHTGRCYNSNSEFFDVPNVTQLIVTANDLPTSEDLGRRALIAELFLDEEVRGRKFKRTITPAWLAMPETRAQFLAACCAIVKNWVEYKKLAPEGAFHPQPLETFEVWTGAIGAMVGLAGFGDPLRKPEMDVGGASSEDEIKTLLIKVASARTVDCDISRKDLIDTAREFGLIEKIVGAKGDDEPDANANKSLGRKLQRFRGEKLVTEDGRRFQFSHKRNKSGAIYPLVFFPPVPQAS